MIEKIKKAILKEIKITSSVYGCHPETITKTKQVEVLSIIGEWAVVRDDEKQRSYVCSTKVIKIID